MCILDLERQPQPTHLIIRCPHGSRRPLFNLPECGTTLPHRHKHKRSPPDKGQIGPAPGLSIIPQGCLFSAASSRLLSNLRILICICWRPDEINWQQGKLILFSEHRPAGSNHQARVWRSPRLGLKTLCWDHAYGGEKTAMKSVPYVWKREEKDPG